MCGHSGHMRSLGDSERILDSAHRNFGWTAQESIAREDLARHRTDLQHCTIGCIGSVEFQPHQTNGRPGITVGTRLERLGDECRMFRLTKMRWNEYLCASAWHHAKNRRTHRMREASVVGTAGRLDEPVPCLYGEIMRVRAGGVDRDTIQRENLKRQEVA